MPTTSNYPHTRPSTAEKMAVPANTREGRLSAAPTLESNASTTSASGSGERTPTRKRLSSLLLGKSSRKDSTSSNSPAVTASEASTARQSEDGGNSNRRMSFDSVRIHFNQSRNSSTTNLENSLNSSSATNSSRPPVSFSKFFNRGRSSSRGSQNRSVGSNENSSAYHSPAQSFSPSPSASTFSVHQRPSLEVTGRSPSDDSADDRSRAHSSTNSLNIGESPLTSFESVPTRKDVGTARFGTSDSSQQSADEEGLNEFISSTETNENETNSAKNGFKTFSPRFSISSTRSAEFNQLEPINSAVSRADSAEATPTATEPSPLPAFTPSVPLQARRLTNNLHIDNFPARAPSPTATSAPNLPAIAASFPTQPTCTTQPATTSNLISTARRMQTLPRLLSGNIPAYIPQQPNSSSPTENSTTEESDAEEEIEETETESEEEPEQNAPAPAVTTQSAVTPRLSTPNFSAAGPSSWVTFQPVTPTPGPLRTARLTANTAANNTAESYFDIPREPSGMSSPRAPPMTPLLPMSASSIARGKRPTRHDEIETLSTNIPPSTPIGRHVSAQHSQQNPSTRSSETSSETNFHSARRHRSAENLLSPSLLDENLEPIGTNQLKGLDPIWTSPRSELTPAANLSPKPGPTISSPPAADPIQPIQLGAMGRAPSQLGPSRLHRRMSMYEMASAPPAYQTPLGRSGMPVPEILPREEEGREGLPDYSCTIHLEGYMPMKKEFTAPSVQAKDRGWRRAYFVLHGTSIKIFKYDLKTHPIRGEPDFQELAAEMAASQAKGAAVPLHVHPGDYSQSQITAESSKDSSTASKFPTSVADVRAKAKSKIVQAATASDQNVLLRHYSLQNAESGLAADYVKRKHVVRVRAEGEQFLLQTSGDRGTIDLIEVLQAATNVALDLDQRVLPKFITLPRRRRRRRRPDGTAAPSTSAGGAAASSAASRASAAAQQPRESLRDMLAEEQHDYSNAAGGGSTV